MNRSRSTKTAGHAIAGAVGVVAVGALGLVGASIAVAKAYESLVAKPARDLAQGLDRVAKGDLEVRLDEPAYGPLKEAAVGFNELVCRLAKQERLHDDFLSNVSHEFKTPLSYIQGFATILRNEDLPAEERREYLKGIETGTRRLSDMVSSLLELAIASNPRNAIDMADFSLDEQLRHALAMFVPLMDQKGIEFDTDLQDVTIHGNETLLGEVWANVLSNAVKYTSQGDTIVIELRRVGDCAVVEILDTGAGMSEERLARAFERFYRDDTQGVEGTGLGLAIAKAIVDSHNGTIELASQLGVGTTCTVTLPMNIGDGGVCSSRFAR